MTTIIVTGHGKFSSGMLTALKLIAGEQTRVKTVDFLETDSTEGLNQKLKAQIKEAEDEILILADLLGGSPFKESVLLKAEFKDKKIEVLSGANFPMLLTATLAGIEEVSELAGELISEGKNSITKFEKKASHFEEPQEDGI